MILCIYLKSDLITGPVIVGVRHNLPFEAVSLLLGNDLAGKKVVAQPIVTNEPAVDAETSEEDADIYQTYVVTRAMEKKETTNTEKHQCPVKSEWAWEQYYHQ
jgi:hypothetical protein